MEVRKALNATDALLTVDDAAAFLRVSRRTVYYLIADGALRPIKIRSCTRFTREQLLAAGKVDSPKAKAVKPVLANKLIRQFDL